MNHSRKPLRPWRPYLDRLRPPNNDRPVVYTYAYPGTAAKSESGARAKARQESKMDKTRAPKGPLRGFALATSLPGPLSHAQAYLLAQLAENNSSGPIVEVHSALGKSTAALLHGARRGSTKEVISIDPGISLLSSDATELESSGRRLRKFAAAVTEMNGWNLVAPVCLPSAQVIRVWERPIGLLVFDPGAQLNSEDAGTLAPWLQFISAGAKLAVANPGSNEAWWNDLLVEHEWHEVAGAGRLKVFERQES